MVHITGTLGVMKMATQTHLFLRNGVYYFRRRIPLDLLNHYFPETIRKYSLKTKDRRKAEVLARLEAVKVDQEFADVRKPLKDNQQAQVLSDEDISRLTQLLIHETLADDDQRRIDGQLDDNGPYVGWTIDPTITYHWNSAVSINSATFYFDDANGGVGVSPPSSVVVNGTSFAIADPPGTAPFSFTASGFAFTGNDLSVTIHRSNEWVFLSEVQFNVAAVPEPETYAMLLEGLGLLGFVARRKNQQAT